jgi:phytoene synthase
MVKRLLAEAEVLYRRSEAGIVGLPREVRPGIFAARYLYDAIGGAVARRGYDSVSGRARVPGWRKCALLAAAWGAAAFAGARAERALPPLAETRFLVEALKAAPPASVEPRGLRQYWSDRIVWVAELFAALEARDRGEPVEG